jgi:predicted Holliday junction resolvase-like endonuclease
MNLLIQDQQQLIEATGYLPAVSLIMPFHPVMASKRDLEYQLKRAMEKIESQLMEQYSREQALPVAEKIRRMINTLNYNTHKKSVAIFASPMMEKVFYLDVAVEERIVIDSSFEIRDLVYSQKQVIQYLVLLLSAERSRMYLGNCSSFLLIKSNVPTNEVAYENDLPEKVGQFSDPAARREVMLDKFLLHMDQGLSLVLNAYPFPVFVLGAEKVLGHFRQITHHERNIVGYVHGNFLDATETEIRTALRPYLDDWQRVRETELINKMKAAEDEHKLSKGIREVRKASVNHNARVLVVEKGFTYAARQTPEAERGYRDMGAGNPFYIKDTVDEVMEKVLAGGGDVQFVQDGVLRDYDHIALIRYY